MKTLRAVPLDAETAQRVLREQVATLYASVTSSTVADTLLAWTVAALFYWQLQSPLVLWWLGLHVLELLRYPSQTAYSRDPAAADRSEFWARRHWQEMVFYSCVWGAFPWMVMPPDNLPMTSMIVLVITGLCSAGVPSVAARWPSVLGVALPMNLALIGALVWHGGSTHLFLAMFVVVYLGVTLQVTRNLHASLTETLLSRFEKEALAEQIAAQMAVTQRLSDEKTRFFASASHDLRQPLHAIALFGAVLERDLQDHSSGPSARRLMRAVHAMGSSLDTMLDVSRLDAGVVKPELVATPVKSIFRTLNQIFAARAEEKGLQLRLRTTPLWVLTDPQLLQRLLGNLVENALKYAEQGGVLVVARARGDNVCIDVLDTGVGIAPEHLDQIFDEFYQIDNPGRDRSQGLGIGLSIVRRLSRLLDHPLHLKSRLGFGSRFRLTLPMALPQATVSILPQRTGAHGTGDFSGGGQRGITPDEPALVLPSPMLLLDDEADVGDAMTALLASHGVHLEVVTNEAEAETAFTRAALQQKPFAALICDYRLAEGVDGLQAAQRLRAHFNPQLPLLLVTGDTAPNRLQSVRDADVPVLFKPVAIPLLLKTLADLTSRP